MKKYKKYWFYLLLVLSISLTIIVINNINDSVIPKIVQDINSGVIGAILTTIITLILLSNQTESQESLTKSSVVYEEKLKIFNSFLDTIGKCLEDGKFTAQETTKIIHSFSILRIHISRENSIILEDAISKIDSSFFFFDENNIPNLNRLVQLYTELTNVFRQELYGDKIGGNIEAFNLDNLKDVLFRKRISILKPDTFNELLLILNSNSKILHTSKTSGITVSFEVNEEIISSLSYLHNFVQTITNKISNEILFTYEINRLIIDKQIYSGIPWIKLKYKNIYFAHFGLTENKRLWIGKNIPERKQIASFEIFETDKLEIYKNQVTSEFETIISQLNKS